MKASLLSRARRGLTTLTLTFTFTLTSLAQSILPNAQVGVAYSFQITTAPAAPAGSVYGASGLPAGLAINTSSGVISGTPGAAGVFDGTVSITGGTPLVTNNHAVRLTVSAPTGTPGITSPAAASGTVGTAFTYNVTASNGPITGYNVSGLPAGLSTNVSTGAITGTPAAAGISFVTLSANNASGTGGAITLTLSVAPAAGTPVISSTATPTSVAVGAALSYQITANNAPRQFFATGLPAGVSLNATTGLISGTPTVAGSYTVSVSAANATGTGPATTVTFTVGAISSVTSSLAASGTIGTAFSHTIQASNTPTSYIIGALPPGLSANTTAGTITGTPTSIGVTAVPITPINTAGPGATATLVITISAAPAGGGGGGIIGGGTVVTTPTVSTQPQSLTVTAGAGVTFSVSASGSGLNFQWSKNGTPISGAQSASLTLSNVSSSDAGTYSVVVSNSAGSVTSASATLTVNAAPAAAPVITSQPVAQSVTAGATATFTAAATGTGTLTYQWRKDGIAITGATNATLSIPHASAGMGGVYSVVITNHAGSVTSDNVTLTIVARPVAGTYVGSFGNNGGHFALLVRGNHTGVFLGFASAAKVALLRRDVVVDPNGRFAVTQPVAPSTSTSTSTSTPPQAAHEGEYHIEGTIAADGTVSGTVSTLNLSFTAPAAATTGATSAITGFYQAGAPGSSASSYAIVGATGDAVIVTTTGATADGGRGTVAADGALNITTNSNARVTGTIDAGSTLTATVTPASGGIGTRFIGANNDTRAETEKLINISTRSQTGIGDNVMIAGFVVSGTQPKPVLIRAIGPTLGTAFNVSGALSAARLEIFRGSTSIATGNDWGAAANAAAIVTTAARVGAFALPAASRDAALLLTLEPGAYTAIVTGQGAATGVSLVEVYDATTGAIPNDQRIVNISTRSTVGIGDATLIAGFYISGTVPKRVLIRGAGPSLAQFGIAGALARPQLSIHSGNTVVAQNAGWSASPDAAAIAGASTQVGAFPLIAASQDAALILHLEPGAYSAQVTGVNDTTGTALVEVYELP